MSEFSGSLTDFTLSAVLRLLGVGTKTGILVINSSGLDGSVFFDEGEISFASTRWASAAGATKEHDRREQTGEQTTVTPDEMIADVLTRLIRRGDGSFTFQAGVQPVHDVEATYPVESILELVELRMEVWNELLLSLGSTDQPYRMARALELDEKVELSGLDWNVLAALGSGTSVANISLDIRLPELETAEILVRLKTDGLVEDGQFTNAPADDPYRTANGGRLVEPDPEHVMVNITDAVVEAQADEDAREEPASELAARWRDLRASPRGG